MSCEISVFIIGTGMYNYKVIKKTVYRIGTRAPQCITFWKKTRRSVFFLNSNTDVLWAISITSILCNPLFAQCDLSNTT